MTNRLSTIVALGTLVAVSGLASAQAPAFGAVQRGAIRQVPAWLGQRSTGFGVIDG